MLNEIYLAYAYAPKCSTLYSMSLLLTVSKLKKGFMHFPNTKCQEQVYIYFVFRLKAINSCPNILQFTGSYVNLEWSCCCLIWMTIALMFYFKGAQSAINGKMFIYYKMQYTSWKSTNTSSGSNSSNQSIHPFLRRILQQTLNGLENHMP